MKKTISVLLAVCLLCFSLLPAAAAKDIGVISLRLNSDLAGKTKNDVAQLIELRSDNVTYGIRYGEPVSIADYAGSSENGALVSGRTYMIDYHLSPANGYTLPEQLIDSNFDISCGKGVTVIAKQIVSSSYRNANGELELVRGIRIYAKVVVDGNIFQRMVGLLHDWILKIKAWSLY